MLLNFTFVRYVCARLGAKLTAEDGLIGSIVLSSAYCSLDLRRLLPKRFLVLPDRDEEKRRDSQILKPKHKARSKIRQFFRNRFPFQKFHWLSKGTDTTI